MREKDIQNEIRLALNPYAVIFRINVGTFLTETGTYVSTGVPAGYTDLSGFRKSDGKAVFIEVKTKNGKTTPKQDNFIKQMRKNGAIAGVARSPSEAIRIVTESE